jgi:hypothetical protein
MKPLKRKSVAGVHRRVTRRVQDDPFLLAILLVAAILTILLASYADAQPAGSASPCAELSRR